jgi:predicted nucleotidyltransferase
MSKFHPPIEVNSSEWEIIQEILTKIVPDKEVFAFGSRAKFLAKPFSDLDLVIKGHLPLTLDLLADLSNAFSDSNLSYKVDIVEWCNISEAFREIIIKDSVLIKKSF